MSQALHDIETLLSSIKIPEYILKKFIDSADIIINDDGYYIWWPNKVDGYHTDFDLLYLAAYIYQKNMPWDKEVKEYFEKIKVSEDVII